MQRFAEPDDADGCLATSAADVGRIGLAAPIRIRLEFAHSIEGLIVRGDEEVGFDGCGTRNYRPTV
jgi:hypothetical protein